MTIRGVEQNNSMSNQMATMQSNDVKSNGIHSKITSAQQQLQKLSSNQELTPEDKKQKRQEVQKQIADLNRELKQRQIELRREQLEKRQNLEKEADSPNKTSSDNDTKQTAKEKEDGNDTEKKTVSAKESKKPLLSASSAEQQDRSQQKVIVALEGKARTLRGEIRQDSMRGQSTRRKEDDLKNIEQRISNTSRVELNLLTKGTEKNSSKNTVTEEAQKAVGRYTSGKMYSSMSFHV